MEGYVPNYIDEIKQRLSIVDIVGQRVSLKKAGKNYKGLCPFHAEKSGSFFVWPESESYHCFGCKESGDAFTFVMKTDGLSFADTIQQLAARAGVVLPEHNPVHEAAHTAERNERERLLEVHKAAHLYFQNLLQRHPEAQAARDYLQKRSVNDDSIKSFGLGYSLEGWENLFQYLLAKDFGATELIEAGLVGKNEEGGHYDRFRGRLIFPIRDRQGNIVAFGGRVLENAPKDAPKYLNSPQTTLFDKSSILYGFDLAKDSIRRSDRVVIVEGYLDVIMAHQFGFTNVVAPLGTALGEKHIGIFKKLTKRVVLALDADAAGQMAALKGIDVMKRGFDSKTVPIPTARGLIRFEQQLDADVRVAVLPHGKDPDDVIREGGKWRDIIEAALPVVDYCFANVAATVDLNSARGKSEAIEALIPTVLEVRDRIQREHYIQKLARLTRVDDNLIRSELTRAARSQNNNSQEVAQPPALTPPSRPLELEDLLLAFLLRYYEDALTVVAADGKPVALSDFGRAENRALFESLQGVANAQQSFEDMEKTLALQLLSYFEKLQNHIRAEPELVEPFAINEAVRFQLNRLREYRLRYLYEQGSSVLEEIGDQEELWVSLSGVSDQLKVYYPKPSAVFKDSRDR